MKILGFNEGREQSRESCVGRKQRRKGKKRDLKIHKLDM